MTDSKLESVKNAGQPHVAQGRSQKPRRIHPYTVPLGFRLNVPLMKFFSSVHWPFVGTSKPLSRFTVPLLPRPQNTERQLIIEGYGYKFLRIKRFNLGKYPIVTLSESPFQLVQQHRRSDHKTPSSRKSEDAEGLSDKSSRVCPKCERIVDLAHFFDPTLRNGPGGHRRICMSCK